MVALCLVGALAVVEGSTLSDPARARPASEAISRTTAVGPKVLSNPAWAQTPIWSQVLADNGNPVAESSPMVAALDGAGPSVVVGDRAGSVYGFHISDGSAVPGWPVHAGAPVDSTPSAAALGGSGLDSIFVGAGNAANPGAGGYEGFGPNGNRLWHASVTNPSTDSQGDVGVQASLTVGSLQGGTDVVAGSLGEEEYALDARFGSALVGWPFFTSDSSFSTPVLADLYGTGQTEIVEGGDQAPGLALGQRYPQGGHFRILNGQGGLICHSDPNQTVDSSPAVGGFLAGGATGAVVGTGDFFPGATDTDTVKAFDTACHPVWSARLDGSTFSSPALTDLTGRGSLDVVEGTDSGEGGSVWALNGATGHVLWHAAVMGRVIGSVTTADLFGNGRQDLLVPTISGVEILDGPSGAEVAALNAATNDANGVLGFQSSPLVTSDPNGSVGVTVAGYNGSNQGVIEHFEVPGSNGARVNEAGAWPMFHHDPRLTGNAGRTPAPGSVPACSVPSAALSGYDLATADGRVFSSGGQPFCGSTGASRLNTPIVGMATAPAVGGYWLVASDGGVFAFGGARFYGSVGGRRLNKPVVGMAATPDGKGYWLVASDGGIFSFGDAPFLGSAGNLRLHQPVVGMAANFDGFGYRLVASDGGVFTFGDAFYAGSTGNERLKSPIVGLADDDATGGYWLVAGDGGVFSFTAPFYGSKGGHPLSKPIVGMQAGLNGGGYRLVASDGGVFDFGNARYFGSMGGHNLSRPVVGITGF